MINHYKLIIQYEGTNYFGWQEQADKITVCGTLKKTFKHAFRHDIAIVGASRTDAGVHANHQVARVKTELDMPSDHLMQIWNRILPDDIVILNLEKCDETFHPQKNVVSKTYIYKVFTNQKPSVLKQRFGYYYEFNLDMQKLKSALQIFVGEHDFRSFCTGYEMNSTIRTIDSIKIKEFANEFDIIFKGEGFLKYMIRRIVGACLEVASKPSWHVEKIKLALETKNPAQDFWTAEPKGLTLENIEYGNQNE